MKDDVVSRQVIMDAFCDMWCDGWDCYQEKCFRLKWIRELPPAQKEQENNEHNRNKAI